MAAIASPPPVSSPINSPFSPRLPSKSPGIPPPVSVPRRRPVAAPTAAAAPTLSVPTPTSSLPMPTSPDRSPSPAASISSLLSAYSNHTAESTPRSSDSYSAQSPTVKDLQKQDSSSPPPLPLKDASRVQIQTQTQPAPSTHTASPLKDSAGSSSSPQDQLWRRRSLKADKHIAVPELNLVASNGSTVNPVAHHGAPTSQPPTQPLPPPPSPLHPAQGPQSRSANGGLPGRNIRPVLDSAEPAVPQIEVNNMGQEASSLKQRLKSKKDHESPKAVDQAAIMSPVKSLASVSPLSAQQRLPTPDYGTHDVLSPQLEVVVSPVSPALTPELPNDQSHPPPPPIPRKALGPALDHRIRHAKSSPSLAPKPSNSALNGVRSPGLPVSPAPGRDRGASHSQAPPLSAGAHGDPTSYPDFYPPPPPPPASYHQRESRSRPQTPTGRSKPISETGSEVTVRAAPPPRPEWLDYPLREPDPNGLDETDNPGAALFPRNWYAPLGPDEILDAKPLENKHFRCITNHRIMTAGKQKNNPIACRLCGHKDRNAECYICSSCHLNVCSGCTGHLRRFKGDLESVLQAIEEKKAPKQLQPLAALQQDGDESATAAFLDED
ncbi:hypothetical protein QBC44DRAFT_238813 [Cladorrhinum sp. PSN332]|nr:hypothetical protein QBC44DRAFT_238813 [Cladorrhinum sp. PSN332]